MSAPHRRPIRIAISLVAAAALSLGLAGTAGAQPPKDRVKPDREAASRGVEAGNAPMGWKHASMDKAALAPSQNSTLAVPSGPLGIDVASYQGHLDWPDWYRAGKRFAYVKATEGTSYRNPYFSSQYTGSYKAGLIRGAYHFANPSGASGAAQARYFVKYGGGWSKDGKTLPGVLDIEYNPYGADCYGVSKTQMVSWISDFLRTYKSLTGRDAVIYTTTDWWTKCTGNTTKFRYTNPLFVARYASTVGTLPGGWPYYTFWQYSSDPIDQDVFSSTMTQLRKLATG